MKYFYFLILLSLNLPALCNDSVLYKEKYRPQYHFSPAHRWIGDPCGTIKHNGRYLAYSWGAAATTDLIHWTELNDHAIKNMPRNTSAFTGSVVVDKSNTSGYGKEALIAAFTSFDENSKKQSQSIAFSHDGGTTYRYFDQNPVLDIWSTEFRDPSVIWDDKTNRWIMLVAKALEKKIAFYGSSDLKHWEWLSDFGPMGDAERSWECPDMFQLPVEGCNERKWVLVISVNWAREQYFTGDFDGIRFIPDHPDSAPLYVDDGLDYYASRVFQDYDDPCNNDLYTIGWINTWDYAGAAPSTWGKGIWSIPRRMSLYKTDNGLRLRQNPVESISSLYESPVKINKKLKPGITPIPEIADMKNVYRLNLDMTIEKADVAGLNLCIGNGHKLTITYDSQSGYLIVDRTNSTDAVIPKFNRIAYVEVPLKDNILSLDILIDKSTAEIFVNNGEKTLTLLTYTGEDQTGANAFSLSGNAYINLKATSLKSIW